jgi:hypothetical protein
VNFPARMLAFVAVTSCGIAPASSAATLVRDLGQGLSYYRVHQLPEDLPSPASGSPGPCVLDLRFGRADESSASALRAWFRFNASARTPILVLENGATSPSLLACVPMGSGGIIVLAPESAKLGADIAVRVAPAADRIAYDALEKGASVDSLLRDFPEKPRVDEAYLDKEHLSDSEAPEVPTEKPKIPPPLVDAMLQRAVQIHRGLIALKRI